MPIKLNGSTSGYAQIQAAATAANNTLTLPSSGTNLLSDATLPTTTPTNGQIPIGNGTTYVPATITAGTGITVTNGAGSITIAGTSSTTSAKAWVNFNGTLTTPITPRANYNVSSVTKNSTGNYTLNFTSSLSDANYSAVISTSSISASRANTIQLVTLSTSTLNFTTSYGDSALGDASTICAVIFGN
jgi:hypothetical protein